MKPFPEDLSFGGITREFDDRGLVAAGVDGSMVLTRPMHQRSRRFVEARALWHASSVASAQPYLLTRSASTTQAIGRA